LLAASVTVHARSDGSRLCTLLNQRARGGGGLGGVAPFDRVVASETIPDYRSVLRRPLPDEAHEGKAHCHEAAFVLREHVHARATPFLIHGLATAFWTGRHLTVGSVSNDHISPLLDPESLRIRKRTRILFAAEALDPLKKLAEPRNLQHACHARA
jgi:hypothetical protein